MKAAETRKIQKALRGFGLYWAKIDGDYGPKTREAVKKFQRMHPPLKIDGIAGKKTQTRMFPASPVDRDTDFKLEKQQHWGQFPKQRDVRDFYGPVGRNQTKILLPYQFKIAWDTSKTIKRLTCHKKVAEPMQAIFEETLQEYGLDGVTQLGLDMYGGCLNVRKMRGGSRYSMHSWGIAIDIDPARNQFRWTNKKARLARPEYDKFWEIVEKNGGVSLGRERNFDWMHIQFARL